MVSAVGVRPGREGVQIEHWDAPAVDGQRDDQYPEDVEHDSCPRLGVGMRVRASLREQELGLGVVASIPQVSEHSPCSPNQTLLSPPPINSAIIQSLFHSQG